jgi:hypothetical protein
MNALYLQTSNSNFRREWSVWYPVIFEVGLVVSYIAMAGIASSGYVEGRLRKMLKGNKHPY